MHWHLIVKSGLHQGKIIPITTVPFLIGRDSVCQLRPVAASISKRHCAITIRGGGLFVTDCHSAQGTIVNGRRLDKERELHLGDQLRVGPLVFQLGQTGSPVATVHGRRQLDDDAIAQMLLDMDSTADYRPVPSASPTPAPDAIAFVSVKTPADRMVLPATPNRGQAQLRETGSTASAAASLLSDYVRRPGALNGIRKRN